MAQVASALFDASDMIGGLTGWSMSTHSWDGFYTLNITMLACCLLLACCTGWSTHSIKLLGPGL
jgi:hypothetical protein